MTCDVLWCGVMWCVVSWRIVPTWTDLTTHIYPVLSCSVLFCCKYKFHLISSHLFMKGACYWRRCLLAPRSRCYASLSSSGTLGSDKPSYESLRQLWKLVDASYHIAAALLSLLLVLPILLYYNVFFIDDVLLLFIILLLTGVGNNDCVRASVCFKFQTNTWTAAGVCLLV